MRAARAAAVANFALVLLIALAVMIAAWLSNRGDAIAIAYPVKHAMKTAAYMVLGLLIVTPFAGIASWRTFIHAQRVLEKQSSGWQGVVEAGGFGVLLTLPFLLPIAVARMFVPEPWSRMEALGLGAAYLVAYGGLGLVIGLALGLMLLATALLVLRFASAQNARSV
jgi:hypothetical protein